MTGYQCKLLQWKQQMRKCGLEGINNYKLFTQARTLWPIYMMRRDNLQPCEWLSKEGQTWHELNGVSGLHKQASGQKPNCNSSCCSLASVSCNRSSPALEFSPLFMCFTVSCRYECLFISILEVGALPRQFRLQVILLGVMDKFHVGLETAKLFGYLPKQTATRPFHSTSQS